MIERGIVVTPRFSPPSGKHVREAGGVDPILLRSCVLFWDKIDYVLSILDGDHLGDEIDLLRQTGILEETRGDFLRLGPNGWIRDFGLFEYPLEFSNLLQFHSLKKHDVPDQLWYASHLYSGASQDEHFIFREVGAEGKVTALSPLPFELLDVEPKSRDAVKVAFGDQDMLLQPEALKGPIAQIRIAEGFTTVDELVPMEEVLELKQKRINEYMQFRQRIDEMVLDISQHGDFERAVKVNQNKILAAVNAINRVIDEERLPKLRLDGHISVDATGMLKEVVTAAVAGNPLGAVLAVIGGFKLLGTMSSAKPPNTPDKYKDFEYFYYIQRDLKK